MNREILEELLITVSPYEDSIMFSMNPHQIIVLPPDENNPKIRLQCPLLYQTDQ